MKIASQRISFFFLLFAAISGAGLLQGCSGDQEVPFSLQSKSGLLPHVYEASCQIAETNEIDPRYNLSLFFGNYVAGGIIGMDISSSDGPIQYFEDSRLYGPGLRTSPASGLHADFDHITIFNLDRFLGERTFCLKPKSVLTVRIYTDKIFEPIVVKLSIARQETAI